MNSVNRKNYKVAEDEKYKIVIGDNYSCTFNKINGFTIKSGNTPESDPGVAPVPELLDLEISQGECLGRCKFCYKLNGEPLTDTKHMSLNTFQQIINRFCVGITIELNNGKLVSLNPFDKVKLLNKTIKFAIDLQENDDFLEKIN